MGVVLCVKWVWFAVFSGCDCSLQLAVVALRVTLWESMDIKSAFRGEVSGCGLVEDVGCGPEYR